MAKALESAPAIKLAISYGHFLINIFLRFSYIINCKIGLKDSPKEAPTPLKK